MGITLVEDYFPQPWAGDSSWLVWPRVHSLDDYGYKCGWASTNIKGLQISIWSTPDGESSTIVLFGRYIFSSSVSKVPIWARYWNTEGWMVGHGHRGCLTTIETCPFGPVKSILVQDQEVTRWISLKSRFWRLFGFLGSDSMVWNCGCGCLWSTSPRLELSGDETRGNMVLPHESIAHVDASGGLINQLKGWGLEHQGLGLWKGCILCRGEGHSKKLRSCFIGDSPSSSEHWWKLGNPHRQMPEKGSGIRKIGYYLFQPANPTTKIQGFSPHQHSGNLSTR